MAAKQNWFWVSTTTAAGTVALVLIACLLPSWYAIGLLLLGLAVFILVLLYNPAFRFWRMATFMAGSWLGVRAIPDISVRLLIGRDNFGDLMLRNSPGQSFDLVMGALIIALLVLDYHARSNGGSGLRQVLGRLSARFGSNKAAVGNHSNVAQFGDIGGNGGDAGHVVSAGSEVTTVYLIDDARFRDRDFFQGAPVD